MIAMSGAPNTPDQEVDALLEAVSSEAEETLDDDADSSDDAADPITHEDKTKMDLKVAAVIPLHEVPGAHVKRKPGRPKKVQTQPTTSDLVYHAEMAKQQTQYVAADAIVRATKERKASLEMLQLSKERFALILATLEFRRIEDEKLGGKESAQILSRQAAVLRDIATLEMRISEMGSQLIDLHSEPVQKVFGMLVEKMRVIGAEVLPQEQFDIFFNRLSTALEGWEEEADALLR